jgi:hypothetical protein
VAETFRELLFEFSDFFHAYYAGGGVDASGAPMPDHKNAINPPAKEDRPLPINWRLIEQAVPEHRPHAAGPEPESSVSGGDRLDPHDDRQLPQ